MVIPLQVPQIVNARGDWVREFDDCVLYFGDAERGIEIPIAHVETPHELWATVIHFGVEKNVREQLGWPCSRFEENVDLGSLVMSIDDLRDLTRIYRNGMNTDAWNGSLNQVTRWLCQEIARLPAQPSRGDYALLGARVRDHADLLDLNDVFGGAPLGSALAS